MAVEQTLRLAARALARSGLVDAYGHCSIRLDDSSFLVTPSMPLGQMRDEPGLIVSTSGGLPAGVAGEVRLHQAVYHRRSDVNGIVRVMPPSIVTLSALGRTLRPLERNGAYFSPGPPLWGDPVLIRDDDRARAVADLLGDAPAVVMRGNGAVVAAQSLPRAVVLAKFLEDGSTAELAILATGVQPVELSAEEAAARAVWSGGIEDRMWAHLTRTDPENDPERDL